MNGIKVLTQEELPEGERRVAKAQDRSILLIRHQENYKEVKATWLS
jgi:nitrite reductase/ring-hydroxylating ferredoxin subunit